MSAKRIVALDDIDHLPTEIHRKIARQMISIGEWELHTTTSSNLDKTAQRVEI